MEPSISVVTALLDSVVYKDNEYDAPVVPEADFVPFDLSYLRDFAEQGEQSSDPLGGREQNASDALPA
jgi:hypothetical protein